MSEKKVVDMSLRELKKMCEEQSNEHGHCGNCPAYYKHSESFNGYCELATEPCVWRLNHLQRKYHAWA